MKYPKEYAKKALDVIGENYFEEGRGPQNVALMTLAAFCIDLVAEASSRDRETITFEMVQGMLTKPQASHN